MGNYDRCFVDLFNDSLSSWEVLAWNELLLVAEGLVGCTSTTEVLSLYAVLSLHHLSVMYWMASWISASWVSRDLAKGLVETCLLKGRSLIKTCGGALKYSSVGWSLHHSRWALVSAVSFNYSHVFLNDVSTIHSHVVLLKALVKSLR